MSKLKNEIAKGIVKKERIEAESVLIYLSSFALSAWFGVKYSSWLLFLFSLIFLVSLSYNKKTLLVRAVAVPIAWGCLGYEMGGLYFFNKILALEPWGLAVFFYVISIFAHISSYSNNITLEVLQKESGYDKKMDE